MAQRELHICKFRDGRANMELFPGGDGKHWFDSHEECLRKAQEWAQQWAGYGEPLLVYEGFEDQRTPWPTW